MTTMRERFEAYAVERGYPLHATENYGLYFDQDTQLAWAAWQAAEAGQRAEIAALKANVQEMALQALTAEAQHDDELGKYMAHHDALMAAAEQAQELLRMFVTHQCVTSDRFVAVLQKLDSAIYAVRHST